jgi:hypothetical protein
VKPRALRRTPTNAELWGIDTRLIMQILLTLLGLVGAGYIIFSGDFSANTEQWATGIIGLVIGFWLK